MKLKSNLKFAKSISLMIVAVALTASCRKSEIENSSRSIYRTIASDPEYSILTAAIKKEGLVSALDGKGSLTLFAPNDAAFNAAGFKSAADLAAVPDSTLKNILLYHVLGNVVGSGQIPQASNTPVTTLNGKQIFATRTSNNSVFINGVSVIKANLYCTNGVVHTLNRVLLPAIGNIVTTAVGNANLSYLVAAVLRASQGTTPVASVLSGSGPFTVFAPTNQAFINAGFATTAAINAADPNALASILTYHVIAGRIFSSDLTNGLTPTTINGEKLTIDLMSGAQVKGASNSTASNIVATDIVATNGVVHVIDQVLLP